LVASRARNKLSYRVVGRADADERALIEHLFERQNYNPLVRPVQNLSDTLEVGFEVALIQLINLVSIQYLCTDQGFKLGVVVVLFGKNAGGRLSCVRVAILQVSQCIRRQCAQNVDIIIFLTLGINDPEGGKN